MNRMIASTSVIIGVSVGISCIVALLQHQHSFLLPFVNSLFYIALPFSVIGGFLFLLERGWFNITRYAFRKMPWMAHAKETSLLEGEQPIADRELLYRTYSFHLTYPFLITGLILAVLSIGISFTVLV